MRWSMHHRIFNLNVVMGTCFAVPCSAVLASLKYPQVFMDDSDALHHYTIPTMKKESEFLCA